VAQLAADTQKHAGIGFLQFGPRLGYAIDLLEEFVFIGWIGGDQRFQDCFLFLHRREQINQFEAAAVENLVHLLLLVVGQA
jgi:hypothetical protein